MIHKKWAFYCSGRIIKLTQFGLGLDFIKIVLNDEAHFKKKKIYLITGFITESDDFHFQNGWQKERSQFENSGLNLSGD